MKKMLLACLVVLPFLSFGQKFYVNTSSDKCDKIIAEKLNKLGYLTTDDSTAANYKINAVFIENHSTMALKFGAKESGSLIFKNAAGQTVYTSKEQWGNAAIQNGYNAKADVVKRILRKDFYAIIKNLPPNN